MSIEPFRCWHCDRASFNPIDARERYCGACHHFCDAADDERVEDLLEIFTRGPHGETAPWLVEANNLIDGAVKLITDAEVDQMLLHALAARDQPARRTGRGRGEAIGDD